MYQTSFTGEKRIKMMSDEIYKQFVGKRVFVVLKSKQIYHGVINSITEGNVLLIDKFHKPVIFNISEISVMEGREENDQ